MSSMSIAEIGMAVGRTIALSGIAILGGVKVLGYTTYKVVNKAVPYTMYQSQKQSISEKLKEMLKDVKSQCDDEIFSGIKSKYKKVEDLIDILLKEFTYQQFSSGNSGRWLETKINNINQQVIEIKILVKELMEMRECRNQINEKWKDIKDLAQFYEVNKLQSEIKNLSKKSLSELKLLDNEIQQVANYLTIYQTIEKQFDEELLPKGEGELHKGIKEIIDDIKALKTSTHSPLQKQRLLEEYTKKMKVLLEQSNILIDIKLISDDFSMDKVISQEKEKKEQEALEKLHALEEDLYKYMFLIKDMDNEEYLALEKEINQYLDDNKNKPTILRNLKDRVKITYGKIKEDYYYTKVYKDEINSILKDEELEDSDIRKLGAELLEKKYIKSKEFWGYFQAYRDAKKKEALIREKRKAFEKFLQTLESKGYTLLEKETLPEIKEEEIIELETPLGEDYKLQVKFDKEGHIITRFAKETEKTDIGEYEKQRDVEVAKKWCETYKDSITQMNGEGYPIEIKAIQEPEEVGIVYIERKETSKRRKGQKTTQIKEQERKLQ
ncbi:MAG TPA: hypothetical protein PLX23_02125 [Candidatus Hydrogenedens sp.]|nr:hypothetical protein [Candidatus Hydrogenedens sp.]